MWPNDLVEVSTLVPDADIGINGYLAAIREMLCAAGSQRAPAVYGSAIIVGPHVPLRPEMAVA